MKVLITGALGRVGVMVVEEALAKGFHVRATDLDTPKNRETGATFSQRGVEVVYGNLLDEAFLQNLLLGVDAVMHNAAMLPPHTETKPEIAHKVNVGVTKKMTELIAQMSPMPRLIFPSSFTVFGQAQSADSFKAVDDPLAPNTEYTRHKAECEGIIRASGIPFVIVRLGAAIDGRETSNTDKELLIMGFVIAEDTLDHWVHPKDVALAQCNACVSAEALGNTYHLGGPDANCRVAHYDLVNAAFDAMGLRISPDAFGKERFNSHWMDTTESQRVLQFQRHNFEDYRNEYREKFKAVRPLTKPLAFILNPLISWYMGRLVKNAREVIIH